MFKNEPVNKKISSETYDVIVGKSSKLDGNISSEGSIRIEGIVTGNVEAQGNLIVGPDAKLNGDIRCKNIEISGEVKGNVVCTGHLKVYAQGILYGDIEVTSFNIEEGGLFDGNCKIETINKTKIELPKK
ncbi:MAG: polymer-forming cytoskeletal protein [Clostridiales bacterium]|nr:polymer-forming cytoskeletal protein [Clostridiales bacterium]